MKPQDIDGIYASGDGKNKLLRQSIKAFKHRNAKELAKPLANFTFERLDPSFIQALRRTKPILTWAPLHPSNQRFRGYNQAELLSLELAKLLQLPCQDLLIKTVKTKDQTNLNDEKRMLNVQGVFDIRSKIDVAAKNFVILDDTTKTGSTLKECAKTLKRHGANVVWGLTVAQD